MPQKLHIIGGGLAGSEAAWQAAERGIHVILYEMRPQKQTPAHVTGRLAELVCSNSLGSKLPDRPSGLLKQELLRLNSMLMKAAEQAAVPAGGALAVDREAFANYVEDAIMNHPRIQLVREEVTAIPDEPCIIATGPLTSTALAEQIAQLTGEEYLYFYDALTPLIEADSINMDIAFSANRWGRGESEEGDYINCPLNQEEYEAFVDALVNAERIELRDFEREDPKFFEGCLPVEQIAARGKDALAFGPMRPVGLKDPRTGKRPYAVLQLRQDNLAATLYNMVGFQTNLRWPEQKRVFRMIPGLENARFARLGQMHRNTFLNAPVLLRPTMQFHSRDDLFFAGQITGIEGYAGNIASGLVAGINAAMLLQDQPLWVLPNTTMIGALCHYVTHADPKTFQPMKANFDLVPKLDQNIKGRQERRRAYAERALQDLDAFLSTIGQPI
ncbi:MAG: methylenetetrahydrofolate--tRNA-(uracil(54)-C(5))-methyltransferase (FADH(2)-oxidizing) TrmFO [Phototrophicales bacterium]|nr:MAG: methylenetetrahydrofolate--tRNA-(uracil(54)-C(5))-methyltransferase (FADH(2)-oxidizing) TrmFO [Phototrophicales bacterium]